MEEPMPVRIHTYRNREVPWMVGRSGGASNTRLQPALLWQYMCTHDKKITPIFQLHVLVLLNLRIRICDDLTVRGMEAELWKGVCPDISANGIRRVSNRLKDSLLRNQ